MTIESTALHPSALNALSKYVVVTEGVATGSGQSVQLNPATGVQRKSVPSLE
jgi:hypothetical protein